MKHIIQYKIPMIKINYKNPEETESKDDIARANIIMSDKFKKGDYLEMSCISWLKIDSKRDYQDLEQLLRYLDVDSHIVAQRISEIPEGLEINYPNGNVITEPLEYVVKIACRSKEDSLKVLLSVHSTYEENFECLKKTGCLMVKKIDPNLDTEKNLSNIKGIDEVKNVLDCKLKLDFTYFKPIESINFIIEDLISKYEKIPEQIACGEINGNKVYALMMDGQIASPIGWMKKSIVSSNILDISEPMEQIEQIEQIEQTEQTEQTESNKQIYSNKIDFDEASRLWRQNKKYLGNGFFRYKCAHYSMNKNAFCNNPLYYPQAYCKYHFRIYFVEK